MSIISISKKLEDIFRTLFDDANIKITTNLSSKDITGWDSLNNVMLFVEVEKAFSIRFRNNEITKLDNVGELINLILAKTSV